MSLGLFSSLLNVPSASFDQAEEILKPVLHSSGLCLTWPPWTDLPRSSRFREVSSSQLQYLLKTKWNCILCMFFSNYHVAVIFVYELCFYLLLIKGLTRHMLHTKFNEYFDIFLMFLRKVFFNWGLHPFLHYESQFSGSREKKEWNKKKWECVIQLLGNYFMQILVW